MLKREEKIKLVEELTDKLSRNKAAFFVSFSNVDVKTSQSLRKTLKAVESEYKIIKKTLLKRALQKRNIALPQQMLQGQVGIVLDYASEVGAAKVIADFTKTSSLAILGGVINTDFLSEEDVKDLALLPDMDTLRSRLASTLNAPVAGLARALKGIQRQYVNILKAIASRKPLGASV